jgi:hypothetical protein
LPHGNTAYIKEQLFSRFRFSQGTAPKAQTGFLIADGFQIAKHLEAAAPHR